LVAPPFQAVGKEIMSGRFPDVDWLTSLQEKLNSDEQYARIAQDWEGDLLFHIEPQGALEEPRYFYLDLWHGACREVAMLSGSQERRAEFVIRAPYPNFVRVLKGEWAPMQALLTRKLQLTGNIVYLMRHVPTVLDFVRCCQEITSEVLGD
jgi:putative sterol carrier protein